ncbi:amidase family protein [Rhizobium mayense]|uniref:Amidase family protein n=1 Tax=Rhizobium mayense TaxID=1312184 RepID=A0ABT7JYC3_9HYPH|nr:amidase family protein [Rhizobium mayense]MDL2400922.1 amidase family protein [Rhizobium mayense]
MSAANQYALAKPLGIRSSLDFLASGTATLADLVKQAIDGANALNSRLHAIATIATDRPLRDAAESAKRWREGRARSLEEIPIAVKDLIDTEDMETGYGSAAYHGHIPCADAEVVRQLRQQGAIIVGKTTTHEFALGDDNLKHKFRGHTKSGR